MPGSPSVSITLDAAGERHDLHPRTVRRAIARGDLPGYKIGRSLRVNVDELDAWVKSKPIPNARTPKRVA